MTPAGAIAPPGWMTEPAATRVIGALVRDGAAARFVGGAVRDAVLGRAVADVDIATPLAPADAMRALEAAGIKVVPTGLDHGTITAVTDARSFEITTLRRDVETFGRHARVAYTDDWAADAARRDFTINALFADADGTLYDPTGQGLDDLRARRVRFIGDPAQRIAEDYLRLLRFFRFHAHYGGAVPDAAAVEACAAAAPKLAGLSAERIGAEIKRLLAAPDPTPMLVVMAQRGILAHILPQPVDPAGVGRLVAVERGAAPAPWRRLAALLEAPERVGPTALRLRLSNEATASVGAILGAAAIAEQPPCRLVRRFGRAAAHDGLLLAEARGLARDAASARRAAVDAWVETPLPIGGADVLALGIAPGPRVGALLGQIAAWWEVADCTADRGACLAKLKALVGA
jgi:poly(A) polymerase